ncbi:uncharacterized protein LOC6584186 [Drosophila mojavensis]|uniref:Uncharacterized protein n=1 Tax=Drosophila mojavensis TaxID=7230 RepID=B4L3N1_DROMO|nr:uncharacterized protein LOC6584186 [Drosophila mojavensis]EDW07159.1 uncharacterized protein Dmoj_GI15588 [Drosophila mojavensis]
MQQVIIVSLLLLSACALAAPSQQLELQSPPDPQSQRATDLVYTPIKPVTDENRYTTLNPDVKLTALNKVKHAKGSMVFSSGERISGDKLLVNNYDDESFTTAVDVEVVMSYSSKTGSATTLTSIEIYVDTTADDASAYFTAGGIGSSEASILLACNQTRTFSYEAVFYGY